VSVDRSITHYKQTRCEGWSVSCPLCWRRTWVCPASTYRTKVSL